MTTHITIQESVRLVKGLMKHEFTPAQLALEQTGTLVYDNTHVIGTTEESVGPNFGDIGTEGLCIIQNLDSTNYVQVGYSTGVYGQRLRAGGMPSRFFLEPGTTLLLKSNVAACNVRIIVYEF